jgi:hypothetical protein
MYNTQPRKLISGLRSIYHKGEGSRTYCEGKQSFEIHYRQHYYGDYHYASKTTRPQVLYTVQRIRTRRNGQMEMAL